jgi:hypothetical protein
MAERQDIYEQTVRLLRDVSRNHAAAAADMCGSACRELTEQERLLTSVPEEPSAVREVEDLGAMLRELEDVGLGAVCRLARESDQEAAFEAIEEAGAGWLRAVMFNRAVETVAGKGG